MTEYVKICGLKKMEDIKLSIKYGANVIGFIYNVPDSPRNLEKSEIEELIKQIPSDIKTAITFRANSAFEAEKIIKELDVDLYQIHSKLDIRDLDILPRLIKKKIIVALKVNQNNKEEVISKINQNFKQFFAFLIDNSEGSGTEIDQKLVSEIKSRTTGSRLIIAGGLNSENVESIIKDLQPYGIDASSSLESERGIKDPEKIKEFLQKVNNVINLKR